MAAPVNLANGLVNDWPICPGMVVVNSPPFRGALTACHRHLVTFTRAWRTPAKRPIRCRSAAATVTPSHPANVTCRGNCRLDQMCRRRRAISQIYEPGNCTAGLGLSSHGARM
jgi:hypothetical protein